MNLAPDLLALLAGQGPVVVLAGAGLSAASGVPTFRDAQSGMWAKFKPEELATPEAFERDPKTVWRWYAWRRKLVSDVEPNPAHAALTDWQGKRDVTIITQNVDGLQQRAGGEVIEFHGNLFVDRCFREHRVLPSDEQIAGEPPTCLHCGALVRPGVVWFGEGIPSQAMDAAHAAVANCAVFVSVGTSAQVHPAASFTELALRNGARFVEINPQATPLSSMADYRLAEAAETALPELVRTIA